MFWKRAIRRAAGSEAGFTLLELLVALVLMALIAVLLATALGGARTGLSRLEDTPESAAVEAVQAHLRRALSETRPIRLPGIPQEAPIIIAEPNRMRFISSYNTPAEYAGLYQVDLELRSEGSSGFWSLVEVRNLYRPSPQTPAPQPGRTPSTTVLLTGLTGAEFTYFGARTINGEAKPAAWSSSWPDTVALPKLIGLRVTFKDAVRRTWQPLMVEIVPNR